MPKPPSTWRSWQLKVAEYLGGRNVGVLGGHDVEAGMGDIEVKHGKQVPRWLTKSWEQTLENTREGRLPILVIHPPRYRKENCLVVIDLKTAREYLPINGEHAERSG